MSAPDQRLFEADLVTAEFRAGVAKGLWGLAEPECLPDGTVWPRAFFWLAAAPRPDAPERFYIALDVSGYRSVAPTGTFWNPITKANLSFSHFPKGRPESRFARVFRTDWGESSRAFYHPYDRVAADSHPQWPHEMPHLVWSSARTIVDYLEEFQSLLMSGDYLGV